MGAPLPGVRVWFPLPLGVFWNLGKITKGVNDFRKTSKGANMFRKVKKEQEEAQKAEATHKRYVDRVDKDLVHKSRDWKREARLALLDKLVPDRRCPQCGKTKVDSRSWVVYDRDKILCRSCWFQKPKGEANE